tara:strand:- start:374 stop:568 length:195 start_codon:yes stop_codon:yes gene_type:complete
MADIAEESSTDISLEINAEWERDYGLNDKSRVQFPILGKVPKPISGSYEPYLPGIDGPGMNLCG